MKLSDIHLFLSETRKERDLAQRDIAEALNVEQATVSMYENGKRGIPLDLLDEWLSLLEIEVKIIPKGYEPAKQAEEMKIDLAAFNDLKKRRNYIIAELRAMMAEKVAKVPEFQKTDGESGEELFWTYSFCGNPQVGLVETRYDHPEQKYLAVEYTSDEVNVYRFLNAKEVGEGESDQAWLKIDRIYFSEDDFLTFGGQWEQESMEDRKVTILRKNANRTNGMEIVNPEGFSIQALLEMQENHARFAAVVNEVEEIEEYCEMEAELDSIKNRMIDAALDNRLANGAMNPEFVFWDDQDKKAIDVPLWEEVRNWTWVEEGIEWVENYQDAEEIHLTDNSILHDHFYTHRHENGSRVIGLVGQEKHPALFKSNPNRPNLLYRVAVEPETLHEEELMAYYSILNATQELEILKEKTTKEKC